MTTPAIAVRSATAEDIPWLLEQLQAFSDFYGTQRALYPGDAAAVQILAQLMGDGHPFFIADRGGWRLGFIVGVRTPHWLNPAIVCVKELFWWVDPEHRGSRAGLLLLDHYRAYGVANATWVGMTLEHDSPVNPQTLMRRGFVPKETEYLLEVPA